MAADRRFTVLHYVGYDDDRGGIVSVVRALAATGRFDCVLGVNHGAVQHRMPPLRRLELPRVAGEKIGMLNWWRSRAVARAVADWLDADPARVFHGHSRAGLLVAGWLQRWGVTRLVVSVHCYGRQRWFYRRAVRRLGARLFWLSPAMGTYYGTAAPCISGGVSTARGLLAPPPMEGKLRLGGVGAMVPWKKWHVVVDAMATLSPEERARVTFSHIGGGTADCRDEISRRVAAAGLSAQVFLRGEEPSSEHLLAEVDALVIASENEPFSMAALEALAAGVPVIAADSGGSLDLVREGINGTFYRTDDSAALAGRLREWLRAPPKFDPEKIRASAVRSETVAEAWAAVYARL